MNIFLSGEGKTNYEIVMNSVKELDTVRLQKQCVESWQLLSLAVEERENGKEIKAGHSHHPVYLFYKNNPKFIAWYGYNCCLEWEDRFSKIHSLTDMFLREMNNFGMVEEDEGFIKSIEVPDFTPFYMEGSLGQPNYIRTTENVSQLFRNKLCKKWDSDKVKGRPPKWTNREKPEWYKEF
ncbi:MAG: hypothetical protein EOL97_09805 [Spirochaetia bacterium]|nr:hypothetical protein [Spirochaetia bacterium]